MNTSLQPGLTGRCSCRMAYVQCFLGIACLAIALATLFGCGRDPLPATVEGTLRLGGRPLDNCLVTFLPELGQEAQGPSSTGLTDQHGSYRLRWDNQHEGAPIGWHRVTVQDLSVSTGVRRRDQGTVDTELEEKTPSRPVRRSRVPDSYTSARETTLRKEVKPGHQVIDLDIK
jgi:hypothetical protein